MLATPFEPLSDDEFRRLVTRGAAVPCRQGPALFVAKWRDGPGLDPEEFLVALRAQGSELEVRRFQEDVNIRVVRNVQPRVEDGASSTPLRKDHA